MPTTLKIAGTKYYNTEPPKYGEPLQLAPDPSNTHDSNAIKVLSEGEQLGHVPAAAAAVMVLAAGRMGYPVEEVFVARMLDGENFELDMVDEL